MSSRFRISLPALAVLAALLAACERRPAAEKTPLPPVPAPVAEDPAWAFHPLPAAVPLPEIADAGWPRQALDRFILAGLEAHQLPPSAPADPFTWLRRASIHLTGLPPTPDAIREFQSGLADPADPDHRAALDAAASRLLASPGFGDQLATDWLDAIRYTDWCDTRSERLNGQWPYRDWVADAFNANLPYDEFLTAQLAGDLLASPTPGQLLATAFLRTPLFDHGPGVAPDEAVRRNTAARTDALGHAILGLPLECARCHDAPDGLLTRDQYQALGAFFDSMAESGRPPRTGTAPAPVIPIPTNPELLLIRQAADAEGATGRLLQEARLAGEDAFQAWHAAEDPFPLIPDLMASFTFDEASARSPNLAITGEGFADRGPLPLVPGISGQAVRCDGTQGIMMPGLFRPERWSEWTFSFWIKDRAAAPDPVVLLSHGPGLDLLLTGGRLTARLHRDWPGNALGIMTTGAPVPADAWTHLALTYDGSNTAAGLRIHVNGRPVPVTVLADQLWGDPLPPEDDGAVTLAGAGPGDSGTPGFAEGDIDDFQAFSRALTPVEVAHLHDGTALPASREGPADDDLRNYYFSSIDTASRDLRHRLADDRRRTLDGERPVHVVSVARELASAAGRPAGAPPRAVPAFLPPVPAGAGTPDRLALVGWLTAPDHPLTARAFVNRLWARFFGRGLVATPHDLGPGGAAPTHPELLDWLARDFVAHGWDVKRLCRQIVLSATYRQSSTLRPDQRARDPNNILLGRYPARPLPPLAATEVLLAASGRLDPTRGGPPDPGSRRTPYLPWTPLPQPTAAATAAGAGASACPLAATPTPGVLDSLPAPGEAALLTASRQIAARILTEAPDDPSRLRRLFATLSGRFPSAAEMTSLEESLGALRAAANADNAPRLVQPGGTATDASELAPWTTLTHAMLRSDTALSVH